MTPTRNPMMRRPARFADTELLGMVQMDIYRTQVKKKKTMMTKRPRDRYISRQCPACELLTHARYLKVREGFIVDEEDELDDDERRRRKKKRRREQREEEEANLDEEDLDLIGEANPNFERRAAAQVSNASPRVKAAAHDISPSSSV